MSVTFYPMDDFWPILAHFGWFWVIFGSGPLLPKLELWEGMFLRMKRKTHPSPAHTPRVWVKNRLAENVRYFWSYGRFLAKNGQKHQKISPGWEKSIFRPGFALYMISYSCVKIFSLLPKAFLSPLELFLCQNSIFASDTALNRRRGDFAILPI